MSDYSPADYAAMNRNSYCNDGMFGGNGCWFLALLILFGGGFGGIGGWNGRAAANAATTEDLANGFNFNSLQGKTNDILAAVNNNNQVLGNAICQLGYRDLQSFSMLEKQLSECCCTTQRAIDGVNYNVAQQAAGIKSDIANYAAATNQAFYAGIQSVKDMFRDYQEANLRDENLKNYIQSQFCGVVRWPNSFSYSTSCNPFSNNNGCNYGCCNQ